MNNFCITTRSPHDFKKEIQQQTISYGYCNTAIGTLIVLTTQNGIYKASFSDLAPLPEYKNYAFAADIDTAKLLLIGTPFQRKVWQATLAIPAGSTVSYQELAQAIGHPSSARAVANALGDNNIPYLIPCHRVVRKDGSLGGYKWGIAIKKLLLEAEGVSCTCNHTH